MYHITENPSGDSGAVILESVDYRSAHLFTIVPQAERGVHGADRRWLWRGAVEVSYLEGSRRALEVGCDRIACYSDRV